MGKVKLLNSDREGTIDDDNHVWADKYNWFLSPSGRVLRHASRDFDTAPPVKGDLVVYMAEAVMFQAGKFGQVVPKRTLGVGDPYWNGK